MASTILCPCCHQAPMNRFNYDGGKKEWFNCPACNFGCGGKTVADKQALAKAIEEYQNKCARDLEVAKAKVKAIKKGNQ